MITKVYVRLKNVSKNFKKETVLKNVDVSFMQGQITGIIGRNGSGKTVMLKIICGLMKADEGEVIVDGELMNEARLHDGKIGAVIEHPGFIPYKSGYKNLKYLADIRKKIGSDEICEAMRTVGLDPESGKHVGKYSLGMKQRLGIAQAIMEKPELIILDEPMNGLDSHGVDDIRHFLLNLKEKGKTIILTSHHAEDIEILCDKVYEMEDGMIKQ